jgi:hypothetical protein
MEDNMSDILYERDLLYPTENLSEPGCVHVEVMNPDIKARIPIVIESKTVHSPVNYIDSIIRIMQSDIFDRVFVDIKSRASIYIRSSKESGDEYAGKRYTRVTFNNDSVEFTGVDEIEG